MKFNRQFKATFLLLLLSLCNFISANERIKSNSSRKLNHKTKLNKSNSSNTHSNKITTKGSVLGTIWDSVKSFANNARSLFYFILGLISAFSPDTEKFYKEAKQDKIANLDKSIDDLISQCKKGWTFDHAPGDSKGTHTLFTDGWEKIDELPDSPDKAEKRREYCISAKSLFAKYKTTQPSSFDWMGLVNDLSKVASNPFLAIADSMTRTKDTVDPCMIENAAMRKELASKWGGNFQNYYQECQFFMDLNCGDAQSLLTTSYGVVMTFMKWADKFKMFFDNTLKCISSAGELVQQLISYAPDVKNIFENTLSSVLDLGGNIGMQLVTAGIWGAVRGTYLLLKMGERIYQIGKLFLKVKNNDPSVQYEIYDKVVAETKKTRVNDDLINDVTGEIKEAKKEVKEFVDEVKKEYKDFKENMPYDIGNIIGLAIRAGKTFLFGGSRKLRKFK